MIKSLLRSAACGLVLHWLLLVSGRCPNHEVLTAVGLLWDDELFDNQSTKSPNISTAVRTS